MNSRTLTVCNADHRVIGYYPFSELGEIICGLTTGQLIVPVETYTGADQYIPPYPPTVDDLWWAAKIHSEGYNLRNVSRNDTTELFGIVYGITAFLAKEVMKETLPPGVTPTSPINQYLVENALWFNGIWEDYAERCQKLATHLPVFEAELIRYKELLSEETENIYNGKVASVTEEVTERETVQYQKMNPNQFDIIENPDTGHRSYQLKPEYQTAYDSYIQREIAHRLNIVRSDSELSATARVGSTFVWTPCPVTLSFKEHGDKPHTWTEIKAFDSAAAAMAGK